MILDGRRLEHPANYALLRITRVGEDCLEDCLDETKPPVMIVDPRAGHEVVLDAEEDGLRALLRRARARHRLVLRARGEHVPAARLDSPRRTAAQGLLR